MWELSPQALMALRTSHQMTARATAFTYSQGALRVPVSGGSVTCDSKSQIRRTGTVEIADPDLFPTDPRSALSPLGSDILIEYGIVIPRRGVEWVPLVRGPIQSVKGKMVKVGRGSNRVQVAGLQIQVSDGSETVASARLVGPAQTRPGETVVAEITRLIVEAVPAAVVVDATDGDTTVAPVLTIDKERWQDGVEKLADAASLEVAQDAAGRFVIRREPTLNDPPVWRVDAGENGVLINADLEQTRKNTYNGVLASCANTNTDDVPAVSALVVDDDPASPTYWGGPFGQKVRYYSSPLLSTVERCEAAARTQLERVKGFVTSVSLEQLVNPALDGGDVIEVDLGDGQVQRHIIDSVPIPLSPTSSQSLTTRSVDLPAEQ